MLITSKVVSRDTKIIILMLLLTLWHLVVKNMAKASFLLQNIFRYFYRIYIWNIDRWKKFSVLQNIKFFKTSHICCLKQHFCVATNINIEICLNNQQAKRETEKSRKIWLKVRERLERDMQRVSERGKSHKVCACERECVPVCVERGS